MNKKCFAEFLGTFTLVFIGTGAMIVNDLTSGTITHVGIAITFGLVVMTMVYAFGNISGAHINPAVTVGFLAAKKINGIGAVLYIVAQTAGAIVASLLLKILFTTHQTLGTTLPGNSIKQSFILEIILTFVLMYVILCVTAKAKNNDVVPGLAIGAVIGFACLFGGPVSGASMNPARSIGPALISGNLQYLWIYITAPALGALIAVLSYRCLQSDD